MDLALSFRKDTVEWDRKKVISTKPTSPAQETLAISKITDVITRLASYCRECRDSCS